MSNYFNKPNSPTHLAKPQETYQYINQYDSYGYAPPTQPHTPNQFAHSQVIRESYHMPSTINPLQFSNAAQNTNIISRVKSESSRLVSSQVKSQQVMKGESRVSYVPYEKKIVEYENRQYVHKVPVKRKVMKYEQRRVIQTVPRQVVKQDYYAVEKRVQYYKEIVPEKRIEMVPVERKVKRYEYVPVQRQIIHYPNNVDFETAKSQSRVVLNNQGVEVRTDAEYKPLNPTLIYNYSTRPESKLASIGYVDQGHSRMFSNAPTYITPSFMEQNQYYPPQHTIRRSYSANKLHPNGLQQSHTIQQGYTVQQGYDMHQGYQNESYIRQLNLTRPEGKRPFEMMQESQTAPQIFVNGQEQQYGSKQPQSEFTEGGDEYYQ